MKDLAIQEEFMGAAALVIVLANLAGAVSAGRTHGYRQLLVRAGAAAHRAWLASLSLGLVGSVFAGLLPKALKNLAGTDGYSCAPLFAYAVGTPFSTVGQPG
jgi:Nitroreductase family